MTGSGYIIGQRRDFSSFICRVIVNGLLSFLLPGAAIGPVQYRRKVLSGWQILWEALLLEKINVALDGPAGAGKSTVARHVAKAMDYIYVDTGAMYRAITWKALQLGIRPEDTEAVIETARNMKLELFAHESGQQVYVDGENVTELIRSQEVNRAVSIIAQIPEVRQLLVEKQKKIAAAKGVVMDGRDIGSSVLPDAEVKIFLTASPRIRAERRFKEMNQPGIDLDELEKQICQRDEMDRNRVHSPLVQAEDAVLLDTSDMDLNEVVEAVLKLCRSKVTGEGN